MKPETVQHLDFDVYSVGNLLLSILICFTKSSQRTHLISRRITMKLLPCGCHTHIHFGTGATFLDVLVGPLTWSVTLWPTLIISISSYPNVPHIIHLFWVVSRYLAFHFHFLCSMQFFAPLPCLSSTFFPLSLKHCRFLNISLLHPVISLAPFCLFSSFPAFSFLLKLQLSPSLLSTRSSYLFSHFITRGTRVKYVQGLLLIWVISVTLYWNWTCEGVPNVLESTQYVSQKFDAKILKSLGRTNVGCFHSLHTEDDGLLKWR